MSRSPEHQLEKTAASGDIFSKAEPGIGSTGTELYRKVGKRLLDLVIAVPLFIMVIPAILLLAMAVVLSSGWPAFYSASRVGSKGPFKMWKLRTMVRNADQVLEEWMAADPEFAARFVQEYKLKDDPRMTFLGRILRQTSLDELPQLWNVILGEMSLVGPRPITESELSHYGDSRADFLSVRPGITGSWQVGGRGRITYPERVDIELGYCRDLSMRSDVAILIRTLKVPFSRDGV